MEIGVLLVTIFVIGMLLAMGFCIRMLIRNEAVYAERGIWLKEWMGTVNRMQDTEKMNKYRKLGKKCDRYREAFDVLEYDDMVKSFKPISHFRERFREIVDN